MAEQKPAGGKVIPYELNKSLDELVNEDASMRRRNDHHHHREFNNRGGERGGARGGFHARRDQQHAGSSSERFNNGNGPQSSSAPQGQHNLQPAQGNNNGNGNSNSTRGDRGGQAQMSNSDRAGNRPPYGAGRNNYHGPHGDDRGDFSGSSRGTPARGTPGGHDRGGRGRYDDGDRHGGRGGGGYFGGPRGGRSGPPFQRDEREVYQESHHSGGGRRHFSEYGAQVREQGYQKSMEGRRIFVSNLAYETQWKYLKDHMRQAGDVVRADIIENKDGTSRGLGLVEFRSKADAQRALSRLDQSVLDGRKLYLKEDKDCYHVFAPMSSNKPRFPGDRMMSPDEHRRPYNRDRGERGRRSRSRSRSGSQEDRGSRGSRRVVEQGGRSSDRGDRDDSRLSIQRRADKNPEDEDAGTSQAFAIFIRNLPYNVSQSQLKEAFAEFGDIMHSSVSSDEKGNSRGFGVVEFKSRQSAERAQKVMDMATFNGQEVQVQIAYDQ